ncbi:MAG: hypothetical protein KKB63_07820, partial [Alphaproteobacteria bacterium]|nr:hypothetical protein [Alphaproteobacteria bacterium]
MTSSTANVRVRVKAYKKAIAEFHDALAALRHRIEETKGEISMVEQAALSLEEVEAKIDAWISQRAANWDCFGRVFASPKSAGPDADLDPFKVSEYSDINRLPLALCALVPERIKAAFLADAKQALEAAPMAMTST